MWANTDKNVYIYVMTPYNNIPNLFSDTITGAKGNYNILVYLPSDYLTKQYPCVLFYNGRGEDTGDVSALAKYSILYEIASNGYKPSCVALCVQALGWEPQQNTIYTTLKKRYNFGKVVLTGLSEGAWVSTDILGGLSMPGLTVPGPNNPIQADTVCFVSMSSQADINSYGPAVPLIAKSGIPVLGTGDLAGDSHAVDTDNMIIALQKANPSGNYTFINTPGTGHGGWNTLSDPNYKLPNGQNIWDWALSFAGGPVVVAPPTTTPVTPTAPILIATIQVYSDGSIKKV
jgi:hypothetical protein